MTFYRINIWGVISALFLAVVMTACHDDLLYDDSFIGEGEGELHATVSFIPLATGLDTRAVGDTIKKIENLCIVIYKSNGEYYTRFMANELAGYTCVDDANTAMPGDVPTTYPYDQAEGKTPRASFTFSTLPYGRYRIYAVGNLGYLTDEQTADEETLKNITVKWNDDVPKNNAMFGYLTLATDQRSLGFNAPDLLINKKSTDLHCWIKRTVSKVTVAFDPSGLKEAVSVYIRSVRIKDIPLTCKLGEDNKPTSPDDLIADGDSIFYGDGATVKNKYDGWLRLQKGSGVQGCKNHTEKDEALFFFENMQGDYEDVTPEAERKKYLKVQIPEETGQSVNAPDDPWTNDFKDRVRYGTYIEVEGYYVSQNAEKISKGPIKYRFMLGKNTTYNYNAERNYHYKLTLKFRGWANEADWHIDYDEVTPTIFVPNPYYISYLYNQEMVLPVRLTGYEQLKDYKLHAQIIENNWAPTRLSVDELAPEITGAYDNINGFAWNRWAYDHTYKDKNYAGFLSMRANQETIVGQDQTYGTKGNEYLENNYLGKNRYSARFFADYNLDKIGKFPVSGEEISGYYNVVETDGKSVTVNIPMFTRPKELIPASDFSGNNPFAAYRRKAIVRFSLRKKDAPDPTEDSYTTQYDVTFKVKDVNGKEREEKYVDIVIFQVPRIVNPKAIWRKHDNTDPFHVQLLQLDGAGATHFSEFKSDGPWRASILTDPDGLIELEANGQKVTNASTEDDKYIHGESGTSVDFHYNPRGTTGVNSARCGIILVEYHDYTCNHLIFVRQGYDCGVQIGANKWSCYNAYATGSSATTQPQELPSTNVVVTNSPLSIGSFFKRCNYNYAILESNNDDYGWLASVNSSATLLKTAYVNTTAANNYSTRNISWNSLSGYAWTYYDSNTSRFGTSWASNWTAVNKGNAKLTIPTYEQYCNLRDNCEYGYGVVYADGAVKVAETVADAYGFTDYDNTASRSIKGIRACIVYDSGNANQVIFPLGAIGQGRRARNVTPLTYNSLYNGTELESMGRPGAGALIYSGVSSLLYSSGPSGDTRSNNDRPLTYNLYREPGAVYWYKQPANKPASASVGTDTRVASWDINYYTLVFNPYDYGSLADRTQNSNGTWNNISSSNSTDALPIKLIYQE